MKSFGGSKRIQLINIRLFSLALTPVSSRGGEGKKKFESGESRQES